MQDWVELPLWLSSQRKMPGFLNVSIQKALKAGLTLRPISDTITSILEWDAEQDDLSQQMSLSRVKERNLLQLWQAE